MSQSVSVLTCKWCGQEFKPLRCSAGLYCSRECRTEHIRANPKIHSRYRHGYSYSPTWGSWSSMRRRCYDPRNRGYRFWGGRGISVCERWRNSFEAFLEDMGERPEGCTLERIDNDGNYEPGNCRWATDKEQQRHRRNNRPVTAFGRTQLLVEWAEEFGVIPERIAYRLSIGLSAEQAVSASKLAHHRQLDADLQSSIESLSRDRWGRDDIMRLYGLTKHFWRRYSGQIAY